MALPSILGISLIPATALLLVIVVGIYKYIFEPAFLGPLARIPNAHWSAPFSPAWILNKRRQEIEVPAVHEAHEKLGPIVRIAPNEISVNSVDGGLRTIYAGGYEKGDWYANIFCNYGVRPMFAMEEHGPHSKRRRMISNIYAKSVLQGSAALQAITEILMNERFVPALKQLAHLGQPVEFYTVFSAITLDFVSAYIFGQGTGSDYIRDPQMGAEFFVDYKARQKYGFFPQEMPLFTRLMSSIGLLDWLVPSWVHRANQGFEAWVLSMCDKAEQNIQKYESENDKGKTQDWPTVYVQLRNALLKESSRKDEYVSLEQALSQQRLAVASEMLDHTLAGFDTSSIALTFLAWELSLPKNAKWQEALRSELRTLGGSLDAKDIDALPILHAILMETLRFHASIPGNQPRITPPSASLGPPGHTVTGLPANVRVQAQAWSLHRNPDVFPDPESWKPDRWLDSDETAMKEMQRWFWAFGSGGRMCVGSNFAMLDMKAIITAIWSNFKTSVYDDSGMAHKGTYVAGPIGNGGKYLQLMLEESVV